MDNKNIEVLYKTDKENKNEFSLLYEPTNKIIIFKGYLDFIESYNYIDIQNTINNIIDNVSTNDEIIIDIKELEYFNSSCIKMFAKIILKFIDENKSLTIRKNNNITLHLQLSDMILQMLKNKKGGSIKIK